MPRRSHTSRQAIVLLWCLLKQAEKWQHGYALIQQTGLKSGTIYPLLIRLADGSFLDARWETDPDSGKPRREYRLTATGLALAHERISSFAEKNAPQAEEILP